MIKGLYFKLNMDKEYDNVIYNFFCHEKKIRNCSKIKLLGIMIKCYLKYYYHIDKVKELEDENV